MAGALAVHWRWRTGVAVPCRRGSDRRHPAIGPVATRGLQEASAAHSAARVSTLNHDHMTCVATAEHSVRNLAIDAASAHTTPPGQREGTRLA